MVSKSDYSLLRSFIDVIEFLLLCLAAIFQNIFRAILPRQYQHYKSVRGEIVLITGGGGGLGRLMAQRLADLGAIVVLWDVNEAAIKETVKILKAKGGTAYGFKCDLSNNEDVYKVAAQTQKEVGDVSILINNAGVVSGHFLLDTPDHLIKRTFDVNILSHFWTTKAFLPKMIEKQHGHIVTIASMAGYVGVGKLVDYCASKHAAVGFDESLRVELHSQGVIGVKTTVVCPYFMQSTGMFQEVDSRFIPTLKSSDVADKVVDGLRRDEAVVMLPGFMKFGMMVKYMVPMACATMFMKLLIPDAAPATDSQHGAKTETPVKNSVTNLKHTVTNGTSTKKF